MKNGRWKCSGSLTVESSFLFPLICIVTVSFFSLAVLKYQKAWYTAAVCETLLAGSGRSMREGSDGLEYAKEKWENRKSGDGSFFGKVSSDVRGTEEQLSMCVEGDTIAGVLGNLRFTVQKEMKVIRPVEFIRKAAAWKEVAGDGS